MAKTKNYRVHGVSIGKDKNTKDNASNILIAFHEGATSNLKLKYPSSLKDIFLDEAPLHETIVGSRPSDSDITI